MDEITLKIENLSKFFEENGKSLHVLNSISLEVKRKEFLTIVGPSGCGKTTLIKIIAGLESPTTGRIIFNGIPIQKPSKKIGYVPQDYSLFPWKTVKGNIKFGLKLERADKNVIELKVRKLLKLTGLESFDDFYPKDISGG